MTSLPQWPAAERPRERLLSQGASSLSDAELLAILLRTGPTGQNVVELARNLLSHFGSLRAFLDADHQEWQAHKGVGPARSATLSAVLELNRRYLEADLEKPIELGSTKKVADYLKAQLAQEKREIFSALFLDSHYRLLAFESLFQGSLRGAEVHPREVVKRALHHNAAALILSHNHPSGEAKPSQADVAITETLHRALHCVDVHVLDHLIVAKAEVISLVQGGYWCA